ncbi:MAG: thiol-disulfide isomerase/thioredoxin [Cyclobacteriaceae bacterium]|jgi:thiol-disulfide isomerase/thioredoxin
MNTGKSIKLSVLLICVCMSFSNAQTFENFAFDSLIGKKAINFQAKTLDGKDFNFGNKRGKNIMLLFWSKYCGGCIKETADLNKIIKENGQYNFELISILDESAEELMNTDTTQYSLRIYPNESGYYEYNRPFHGNTKIDFEIIKDGKEIRAKYGIPNTSPITLFIDEEFIIRDYNIGYYVYANNFAKLNAKVTTLLAEK